MFASSLRRAPVAADELNAVGKWVAERSDSR
jgi:hypothetical protein